MQFSKAFAAALLVSGASACEVTTTPDNQAQPADANVATAQPTPPPAPLPPLAPEIEQQRVTAQQELKDLRFLVDISERKLTLFQGDREIGTHPVSVGTKEWPTPTGDWAIHRVDINPEWMPPKDESWAKDREPKAPGAADNPLGAARLVYRMPNTIHGTTDTASLGKAASHGSIRVANDVVLELAQMLIKAGGSWEGPEWFKKMTDATTKEFQVKLRQPVPIKVQD